MKKIYVSIGSNINRKHNISVGVAELEKRFGVLTMSPIYQSKAYGFNGDDFFNLVACFDSSWTLDALLQELKLIESKFGRNTHQEKFSSRTIDIDVLLYGNLLEHEQDIPRSDIADYAFVLKPLADLAPDLVHPVTCHTIAEMWSLFDKSKSDLKSVTWQLH